MDNFITSRPRRNRQIRVPYDNSSGVPDEVVTPAATPVLTLIAPAVPLIVPEPTITSPAPTPAPDIVPEVVEVDDILTTTALQSIADNAQYNALYARVPAEHKF